MWGKSLILDYRHEGAIICQNDSPNRGLVQSEDASCLTVESTGGYKSWGDWGKFGSNFPMISNSCDPSQSVLIPPAFFRSDNERLVGCILSHSPDSSSSHSLSIWQPLIMISFSNSEVFNDSDNRLKGSFHLLLLISSHSEVKFSTRRAFLPPSIDYVAHSDCSLVIMDHFRLNPGRQTEMMSNFITVIWTDGQLNFLTSIILINLMKRLIFYTRVIYLVIGANAANIILGILGWSASHDDIIIIAWDQNSIASSWYFFCSLFPTSLLYWILARSSHFSNLE